MVVQTLRKQAFKSHPGDAPALQRLQLDLLKRRNERHLESVEASLALQARMESFEMAFRMQAEAPLSWILVVKLKQLTRLMGGS